MSTTPRRLPASVAATAAESDLAEAQLNQPAEPLEETPPEPPAAPASAAEPDDKLLQKYRTLQGIHASTNAKMQRQAQQLQDLQTQLQAAQSAQPDTGAVQAIVAQLREGLGEEMHNLIETRVRAIVDEAIDAKVAPLRSAMSLSVTQQQESLDDLFYDRLDVLHPGWEEINSSPGFLAWLAQIDPATGVPLAVHLKDASAKLDADRAALFFETYTREIAAKARPQPATPPGTQRPPTPSPAQKQVFTGAQIDKFYHDVRAGKYRGREAEAQSLEQEIMNAQREGRVVP